MPESSLVHADVVGVDLSAWWFRRAGCPILAADSRPSSPPIEGTRPSLVLWFSVADWIAGPGQGQRQVSSSYARNHLSTEMLHIKKGNADHARQH